MVIKMNYVQQLSFVNTNKTTYSHNKDVTVVQILSNYTQ